MAQRIMGRVEETDWTELPGAGSKIRVESALQGAAALTCHHQEANGTRKLP